MLAGSHIVENKSQAGRGLNFLHYVIYFKISTALLKTAVDGG